MDAAERAQRERVVAIAREWIGTPYRHGGRIKQVGADCTFFAVVYEEAGLVPPLKIEPYSPQAHLHRASGVYLATIAKYAHATETPLPGDIAMYFFGRDFSHGAVIVDPGWPSIIHGDLGAGYVIEARGDEGLLATAKDRKFFTLWG